MDDEEAVILREQFCIYPGKTKFNISLTSKRVNIEQAGRDKNEDIILLDDIIGCHVLQDKKNKISSAYLCIFSYPLKKKKLGSGVIRQRVTRTFTIDSRRAYQENLLLAETWKMTIKRLVAGEKIRTKEDIENGSLAARNLLVLVNPFSGRKKAAIMYKEKVRPMFTEAEIKHTVRKTEYPGHAKEMAKQLNLGDWDGVVIISGDGLVHEVINGLMDRPDWKEAIKMPIGIVPGGSGNALAASIVYASTGQMLSNNLELDSLFEILKGKTRKMSLAAIETESGQKCYSFLNFAWGFIADVDIESERYRSLGPVRFAIGCAIRVANMRMYHGKISYLPATKNAYSFGRSHSVLDTSNAIDGTIDVRSKSTSAIFNPRRTFGRSSKHSGKEDAIHGDIDLVSASIRSNGDVFENGVNSEEDEVMPETPSQSQETDSKQTDEINANYDASPKGSRSSAIESATHSEEETPTANGVSDHQDTTSQASDHTPSEPDVPPIIQAAPQNTNNEVPIAWKDSAIVYHLRSSLDAPPPDDWAVMEAEYIWVTSVYLSHLGNEMAGVPSARLDDDVMYIYTLRRGISKTQMVSVLLGFEGGTQIERGGDFSSVIPCRAVRLEPLNFITGHLTVDGEPVPHCSIQASVTPHKINLMSSTCD